MNMRVSQNMEPLKSPIHDLDQIISDKLGVPLFFEKRPYVH